MWGKIILPPHFASPKCGGRMWGKRDGQAHSDCGQGSFGESWHLSGRRRAVFESGQARRASWFLRLQRDGKRHDIGLGSAKLLTLAEARDESSRLRSEEHTSELKSLMRISYAVFCLKKQNA